MAADGRMRWIRKPQGQFSMSHAFISYQNTDSDFAGYLMLQLERASIDTWMDKERLRPGYDWSEDIDKAIQDSFAMIVVMSPDARASEYVTYEWAYALGAGIRVIPVLLKDTLIHPRLAKIQYLKFTDPHVRPWDALIRELIEIRDSDAATLRVPRNTPAFIKRAITDLDCANPEDRREGIKMLAATEHPIARESLRHSLYHPLADVRLLATIELARLNDDHCLENLSIILLNDYKSDNIKYLDHENSIIGEAKRSYVRSKPTAIIPLLVRALTGSDAAQRRAAAVLLGAIEDPSAIPALIERIGDSNAQVIIAAIEALGKLKAGTAVARLMKCLDDYSGEESIRIREKIIRVFTELGLRTAAPNIRACLRSEEPALRGTAAVALGLLGDTEAIDDLKPLLNDKTVITDMCFLNWYSECFGIIGEDFSEPISLDIIIKHTLWCIERQGRR